MRKLPVKKKKKKAEKDSCPFASVRVQFMQRISLLFGLLHPPRCNSNSTGKILFYAIVLSNSAAPRPVPRSRGQRHMIPAAEGDPFDRVLRKRYNPPTDGDGVLEACP